MRIALLLSLVATACFGQTVYKNGGTKLGTAVFVDCSADAGVNCTRTPATGTVNLRCSSASSTELGCVSTAAQSFAGAKTFTGAVQAPSYGGSDGGVYVKTSDGASLIGTGFFSTFWPSADYDDRDSTSRLTGVWIGNFGGLAGALPSSIQVKAFTGLHASIGTTDGGVNPVDGGDMIFNAWILAAPTDGGASRTVCSFESGCDYGGGSFPVVPYDTGCGLDGGGIITKDEVFFVIVTDSQCWINPAMNYTVLYTGIP